MKHDGYGFGHGDGHGHGDGDGYGPGYGSGSGSGFGSGSGSGCEPIVSAGLRRPAARSLLLYSCPLPARSLSLTAAAPPAARSATRPRAAGAARECAHRHRTEESIVRRSAAGGRPSRVRHAPAPGGPACMVRVHGVRGGA